MHYENIYVLHIYISSSIIKKMILNNITKCKMKQDVCFSFMGTFISSMITVTQLMFTSCSEGRKRAGKGSNAIFLLLHIVTTIIYEANEFQHLLEHLPEEKRKKKEELVKASLRSSEIFLIDNIVIILPR